MNSLKMEILDSGIGSRSPTPDASHSQINSSKVAKVTPHSTNHINNNSHNASNNGTHNDGKTTTGSEQGDASSASTTTTTIAPTTGNECSNEDMSGGNNSSNVNSHNSSSGNSHNRGSHNSSNASKTHHRDYNSHRHSSGYGQYKKYSNYQNNYYGGHNYHQRYNNNGHRHYGNKQYHNGNYHYNNHHNNYHGPSYQHQHYGHQNPRQITQHNGNKGIASNSNSGSQSNTQHHGNGNIHHAHQHNPSYMSSQSGPSAPLHQYHSNHLRNVPPPPPPPHVFTPSSEQEVMPWAKRGSEPPSSVRWSSHSPNPTIDSIDASAAVQLNFNLPTLKNGFYSPSPQNVSPASSPSTIDSSDTYSLQEEPSNNGTVTAPEVTSSLRYSSVETLHYNSSTSILDPTLNGTIGPSLNGNSNTATGYSFTPFPIPSIGFYSCPPGTGSGPQVGGARTLSHQPQHFGPNFDLLMPADSSYQIGKADSSINSNISDKAIEWTEDGVFFASGADVEDFPIQTDRCSTPEVVYGHATFTFPSAGSFPPVNKKRFYNNGTNAVPGKLSPAVQNRYNNYPRRKPYHLHQQHQGLPKEWTHDFDPEDLVRAFGKSGEVKERPAEFIQSQATQFDSLSEGIWLKFIGNQQTTETFRKKMELWRDVSGIVRSVNHAFHFRPDTRNFPISGLQVVGSTMSGFGSNTSDVDMCLLIRGSEVDQRFEAVDKLQVLNGALSGTNWLDKVEMIYAKVPILKFRDPRRQLEVDLNCNNFVGIRNTHLLYGYSQADWRLKPLVLVVKLWAHYHGINDAKNMTISSYSLVLMVIHFLQCGLEEPVLPVLQEMHSKMYDGSKNILQVKINEALPSPPWQSKNNDNLGNLLVQFLKYYLAFDYSENAVSVRTGGTVSIKEASCNKHSPKNDPHQWKHLCIEEPFDLTNTARSVYDRDMFDKILGIFYISYQRLLASRNLESIFSPISEGEARNASVHIR